jgi:hypothetical protein
MTEHEHEPIRGLPGNLPEGEHILWQGSPEWRSFAVSALKTRWIGLYFAALFALSAAGGSLLGMIATLVGAAVTLGLLALFAVLVARTTIYTITNRRVVLRIGVALNACINLPLKLVGSADLRQLDTAHGDIALTLLGRHRLGYAMLWPHARPFRIAQPQPMLRALRDPATVAQTLARACAAQVAIKVVEDRQPIATVIPAPAVQSAAA